MFLASVLPPPKHPVGPLQPAQTISLGPTAALGGSVQLPNHSTVLLLTDTEQLGLRAVCLSAEDRPLWETPTERYQHPKLNSRGMFAPPGVAGRTQKEISRGTRRYDTSLILVSIFTEGNNLLLLERISAAAVKKIPKGSPLRENQVFVQRLDE